MRTWSASVIFRLSRGRTVRPAHHLSVRGALGARQTLAAGVVHEQKKSAAAAPANPVPRRRARSGFRPSRSAEAAFRALSPAGREFREVSLGARLADSVAVVPARLGRPFPHLAGVARDAVSSFFHRPVSVVPGRTYVSSSQQTLGCIRGEDTNVIRKTTVGGYPREIPREIPRENPFPQCSATAMMERNLRM